MRILFIGDVVGKAGCEHLQKHLADWKKNNNIEVCIANGENSSEGNGITPASAQQLFSAGVDVITTGNHVMRRREIYPTLETESGIIRPANFHKTAPGKGVYILDKLKYQICVINIIGQIYMEQSTNPFECMDELLESLYSDGMTTPIIIVDFHAEATSEKKAMGYYLDGKVSAVLGTHTHVQTADERILPGGTGYLTDVGMCGGLNSVLGVKKELAIRKLIDHMPARFENDTEDCVLDAVVLDIEKSTGKTVQIERVHW